MTNFNEALRREISRIARKEIRAETELLRKVVSKQRESIAALRQQLASAIGRIVAIEKAGSLGALIESKKSVDQSDLKMRFSAEGFRKLRLRLDLTLAEMARLMNVSVATISNWELGPKKGGTRPRGDGMQRIAYLRKLNPRQAKEALATLHQTRI